MSWRFNVTAFSAFSQQRKIDVNSLWM